MEGVTEASSAGFWGPVTANIDWCEANYEVTYYIAEFWNTISNAIMLILPLNGIYYGLKDGLELRYIACFVSLLVVGTGSSLFHSTLLYGCQLLDELPMLWGNCVFLYLVKETSSLPKTTNKPLVLLLTAFCVLVTLMYIYFNEPIIFQGAYGLSVFVIIYYGVKIRRKRMMSLFFLALFLFGSGFAIWLLDNTYCDTLRSVRDGIGYPIKPVFQGHAWWHVLAGIGSYIGILFSIYNRVSFLKQEKYIYTSMGLPLAVRVHRNGYNC